MNPHRIAVLGLTSLVTLALGGGCVALNDSGTGSIRNGNPPRQSICADIDAPAGCGFECVTDGDCNSATFCNNGACDAVCTHGGTECGQNAVCIDHGKCLDLPIDNNNDGGPTCAEVDVETDRVIPNIAVIVDQSGSMLGDFDGYEPFTPPSRWDSARDTLIGPGGIIPDLQSIARFKLVTYYLPPSVPGGVPDLMCLEHGSSVPAGIANVDFALNNASSIASVYNSLEPASGYFTPTAEAVAWTTADVLDDPPPDGPIAFILATDGFPNGCDRIGPVGNPGDPLETEDLGHVVDMVTAARLSPLKIKTYVLGMSFTGALTSGGNHLQDVANAGIGQPNAPRWTANNASQLADELREVVVQQIPCTVELNGTVLVEAACSGTVEMDGEALSCNNTTRGWRAVDSGTIELLGTACDEWRTGQASRLQGTFPCGVATVE